MLAINYSMTNTIYWKRLNLCAKIIRTNGNVSRLALARKLSEKNMPCTPWTIDKIKPDILELFEDITYDRSTKKFLTTNIIPPIKKVLQ